MIKNFVYICNMENERKQTLLKETGNFLVDISKLVFGGIILAGIMEFETINQTVLFIIGSIVVVACFSIGLAFIVYSKPKK